MTADRPQGFVVALLLVDIFEPLGVDYHFGGSYASSFHGVPRQTQDVDIVADLDASHLEPLSRALGSAFYFDVSTARRALESRSSFNLIHLESGVKIDVFCLGYSPFDKSEFERAESRRLLEDDLREVRVKSAEDIVLRKLHWYRSGGEVSDRQWADVLGCLAAQLNTLDSAYLEFWAEKLGISDLLAAAIAEVP